MKTCTKCGLEKPLEEFHRNGTGRRGNCRDCRTVQGYAYKRTWELKNLYGITLEDYIDLYNQQDGKCANCNLERATEVDHDKKTLEIRGILCMKCNTGIGLLGDTLEDIEKAVQYLSRPRPKLDRWRNGIALVSKTS